MVKIYPAALPAGTLAPGINCGNPIAPNPTSRKCCSYASKRVSLSRPNIPGVDQVFDFVSGMFDKFLTPVLNPVDELIIKTVQPLC